ncbi:MAG TPA: formate dehydrogenase accessory sulfurtransferase FdhD [Thermoanaerobaculia bacterium]
MNTTSTASFAITRVVAEDRQLLDDVVAIEEPLEIAAAWTAADGPRERTVSVTMRTPGDDFDLAAGLLFAEGLVRTSRDIASIRHWSSPNRVRVTLAQGLELDTSKLGRNFYSTASCGVCGKTSIDALATTAAAFRDVQAVRRAIIEPAARALHDAQTAFRQTGGVHGAAVVDASGAIMRLREDIGRHNAVDKVIGSMLLGGASFRDTALMVSSRAGFEIVQKAVVAGIPALISIGAPSSLAIDLARRFNLTLIGFVRDGRFNVYAGEVR